MSRLAAVAKELFYPTPTEVLADLKLEGIPTGLRWIDPCVGDGVALSHLVDRYGGEGFGVDISVERIQQARQIDSLTVRLGSYHQIDPESRFDVLFLNPPYDQGDAGVRLEHRFLTHMTQYLQPGGLLIYVVPRSILLSERTARYLSRYYERHVTQVFPEPYAEQFDQAILLCHKRASPSYYGDQYRASFDEVVGSYETRWASPYSYYTKAVKREFEIVGEDPNQLFPDVNGGVWGSARFDGMVGRDRSEQIAPLCSPRPGHRAMLLAAGALNGVDLDGDTLLKGTSRKVVDTKAGEDQGGDATEIRTERIVSMLSTLCLSTGEVVTWRADEDVAKTEYWFRTYQEQLRRAVEARFVPQSSGVPPSGLMTGLRAPGVLPGYQEPTILGVQQEAAWAIRNRWRTRKAVVLAGEQGTGKTTIATVATQISRVGKTVVVCPAHLVEKWARETELITGRKGVSRIAKRISCVDAFFADPLAEYLVVSQETAKLGMRWVPSVIRKRERTRVLIPNPNYQWGSYREPPNIEKLSLREVSGCSDCGATVPPLAELGTEKQRCESCGGALWQVAPLSQRGTVRWPLAEYISQRYARRYALVVDEAHGFAGADSDRSRAIQDLESGSRKTLAMTGTLYGGRASSVFHLLYKLVPEFRQQYRYTDAMRFAQHQGLFEQKVVLRAQTGRYGYRRGGESVVKTREIPGMNPGLIPMLLPYCVFIRMKDLELSLPEYTEEVRIVEPTGEIRVGAREIADAMRNNVKEHRSAIGAFLQAGLGWVDRTDVTEEIYWNDPEDAGRKVLIHTQQGVETNLYPKDMEVLRIAQADRAEGRKTLVFCTQVGKRDTRDRLAGLLREFDFRVGILDQSVAPDKREQWIRQNDSKIDVLITNGRLVETGLDLLSYPTVVQYGVEYSLNSLRQSIRRSWRLGQRHPVRVYFLGYRDTMQEAAWRLIARKMRAAELVDGDECGGLSQHDESGVDLLVEIAQQIMGGDR